MMQLFLMSILLCLAPPPAGSSAGGGATPIISSTVTDDADQAIRVDSRLDRPVSLDYVGISISDLTNVLGGASIKLRAADECGEQKLQLHVRNRTVREVMQSIGALLPGYWIISPSGYVLRMKQSVVFRRTDWWTLFNEQHEAAIKARSEAILKSMRSVPVKPDPAHPSVESGVQEGYLATASAAELYNRLPPDLQERIASQFNDMNLFTNYFAGNTTEGGVVVSVGSLPSTVQSKLASGVKSGTGVPNDSSVFTLFMNHGTWVGTSLLFSDGTISKTGYDLHTFNNPNQIDHIVLGLDQTNLPQYVERLGQEAPPLWKRLSKFQVTRDLAKQRRRRIA